MLPEGSAPWSLVKKSHPWGNRDVMGHGLSFSFIFCMKWLLSPRFDDWQWVRFDNKLKEHEFQMSCHPCVAEEFHGFWIQPNQRRLPPGCVSCLSVLHGPNLRLQTEARHSIKSAAAWRPPQPPQLELRDLGMWWRWCHTIFIGGMLLDSFSTDLYSWSCFLYIYLHAHCQILTNCQA